MMRPSILAGAIALLCACSTPEERAAYREDPVIAMAGQYGPSCERLGHAKGSEPWRRCIASLSTRDDLIRHSMFHDRYMQWYWIR